MSTALTHYTTDSIRNPILLAEHFANSGYFQDTKDVSKAVVKIVAGQELGFGPMASMAGFHLIQGKPTLSANLMAAAIKRSGRYNYRVKEMTPEVCSIDFFENKEFCGNSTFTLAEAQKAGTKNIDKFARNMLFARALSNGAKWFCPDVLNGSPIYTPEELGAEVDESGEVVATVATVEPKSEGEKTPPSEKQLQLIHILLGELAKAKNGKKDFYENGYKNKLNIKSFKELTVNQASQLTEQLRRQIEKAKATVQTTQDGSLIRQEHPPVKF